MKRRAVGVVLAMAAFGAIVTASPATASDEAGSVPISTAAVVELDNRDM